MPVGTTVHKIYARAADEGSLRHDITTIIQPMERDAGIELPKTR
jgi:hypothetical protein